MPVPSLISNHSDRAYDRLLGQFKDKEVISALLRAWTDVYQELENDAYDVMMKTLFLIGVLKIKFRVIFPDLIP